MKRTAEQDAQIERDFFNQLRGAMRYREVAPGVWEWTQTLCGQCMHPEEDHWPEEHGCTHPECSCAQVPEA